MEEKTPKEEIRQEYEPRPSWQVWAARAGLVIFLIIVALQCVQIAGGLW